ncbi:MAG: hypothetical protein NWF05_05140 [Candidatus Bathyarchaeota archaeon]|nr:hypothetical protein [Candidatus Bathyarchaeota archaeon]
MNVKKQVGDRIRGWLPKEQAMPRLPLSKASRLRHKEAKDWENRFFKASIKINAIVFAVVGGIRFLVDPFSKSTAVSVTAFSALVLVMILANFISYRHFKKQAHTTDGEVKT